MQGGGLGFVSIEPDANIYTLDAPHDRQCRTLGRGLSGLEATCVVRMVKPREAEEEEE